MQLKSVSTRFTHDVGEYAVLYGKHALVCAVDKRITVTLTPRDDKITIHSICTADFPQVFLICKLKNHFIMY